MKEVTMLKEFREKNKGRKALLEHEVKGLFQEMGFSVPRGRFYPRGETPLPLNGLVFPLVAKVSSATLLSKSDVRGVKLGIKDEDALQRAVQELFTIENAEGVLVEEMAPQGLEVIVGGTIDPQFGPVAMFGLGGVFVEMYRDVAFALAPLTMDDAAWLMGQIKGYRLLEGYRGNPPLDRNILARLMMAVSELIASGLCEEIDLNPVALFPEGALILDAKMQLMS
jgi:hypothetical protein